ncbi:unnamed protein product [Pylaiella littoralis]
MEGPSGHLSREAAQQLWSHLHSHLQHSAPSTASPSVDAGPVQEPRYGFSSPYEEPQQQQQHHQHYHHQLHRHQQGAPTAPGGGRSGGGGSGGGGMQLRHHHLQQHQDRQEIPMMPYQNSQSSSLGSNGGDPDANLSRLCMSVHDLKQMTAMRMGGGHQDSDGGGGGDNRGGGSSGGGGGGGGGGSGGLLSSASLRSPTGSDQLSSTSLHRLVGLVEPSSSPDLMGAAGLSRPSSAPHQQQQQKQKQQHMLRAAREQLQLQQQQQQHDLPPPNQQQQQLLLPRRNSAGSSSIYSRQQQQQQQQQLQSGAGRGQQQQQLQQQPIERGIRRGVSAPRMYPTADEQPLSNSLGGGGGGGGGGGVGGQRPVFGPGLSVEELKELTKIRLQQQQGGQQGQQGQGRSSPSFKGRPLSTSALGSHGGGGGSGHRNERTEWGGRSGSAGSAAMMEEHHRATVEDGASISFRRRANSLMVPRGGGLMHGDPGSAPMHGGGRVFGNGNGRMEGPLGLEDRMRSLQSEGARGGGGGGISPRILSQPSSPCFSAASHSSSACTSPGRGGRAGGSRHGGSGAGVSHFHGNSGPPGFPSDGAGVRVDGGGALHTTLSLRLGSGGRRGRGGSGGSDDGFWGSSGSSGFATAAASGNIARGFPSGGGGGGGGGRGVIGGASGSRSTGASPSMHAMSAPKSLVANGRSASRLSDGPFYDDHSGIGGGGGTSHGSSMLRPGSAGPPGRSTSWSASLAAGDSILSSRSVHGLSSSGGMVGRDRVGAARKSSYDDRRTAGSWLDGPRNPHGGTNSSRAPAGRPSDLSISHTSSPFDHSGAREVSSTWEAVRGGGGGGDGGGGSASAASEDMTAMMCAEFALLTPKRALEQHQQQHQQQHQRQRQQASGRSSPSDMWSSDTWTGNSGGGGRAAAAITRGGSANSSSAGSGSSGGGGGLAVGSQGSRGDSVMSSPEGPHPSRVGGVDSSGGGGGGDDADENSASSGGSGGGGRQSSVRPAFGATPDSAAGPGGGGGGEASVGGGTFDARHVLRIVLFPLRADGNASTKGNGSNGGGVEAQRYDMPLKTSSFFGNDIEGVALENTAGGVPLSSSVPDNLSRLHLQQHHHHAGGAFSTGASPARSGGGGSGAGEIGISSPGPLDGSSLAAALQNQRF